MHKASWSYILRYIATSIRQHKTKVLIDIRISRQGTGEEKTARRFLVAHDHSTPRPLDMPTLLDMKWRVRPATILSLL